MEKIIICISSSLYNILEQDMNLFEFYKKDGSLNRNDFYNHLIINYYQIYFEKQTNNLNQTADIPNTETSCTKYHKMNIAFAISQKMKPNTSSHTNEKMDKIINIKPTRQSKAFIEMIKETLNEDSLSAYFRDMFTDYTSLPINERETIIFKPFTDKINEALKRGSKLVIKTKTEGTKAHIITPYGLVHSKKELYNHLLCVDDNYCAAYRLSRIKELLIYNESGSFTNEQKLILKKMTEYGPKFSYTGNAGKIIVHLTDKGKRIYKDINDLLPIPYKVKNDLYYFDCSAAVLMHYLKCFGTNATVIVPIEINEKMTEFHELTSLTSLL